MGFNNFLNFLSAVSQLVLKFKATFNISKHSVHIYLGKESSKSIWKSKNNRDNNNHKNNSIFTIYNFYSIFIYNMIKFIFNLSSTCV